MGWNNIENTLIQANAKITHKILHEGIPEIISHRIKSKLPDPDMCKIGQKPDNIGRTKTTRAHYRANAYRIYAMFPDAITDIKIPHFFKKWTGKFLKNPNDLPKTKKTRLIPNT